MKKYLILLFLFNNNLHAEPPFNIPFSTIGPLLCAGITIVQLYRTVLSYNGYQEAATKNTPFIPTSIKPLVHNAKKNLQIKKENAEIKERNVEAEKDHKRNKILPFLQAKTDLSNNSALLIVAIFSTMLCCCYQPIKNFVSHHH